MLLVVASVVHAVPCSLQSPPSKLYFAQKKFTSPQPLSQMPSPTHVSEPVQSESSQSKQPICDVPLLVATDVVPADVVAEVASAAVVMIDAVVGPFAALVT